MVSSGNTTETRWSSANYFFPNRYFRWVLVTPRGTRGDEGRLITTWLPAPAPTPHTHAPGGQFVTPLSKMVAPTPPEPAFWGGVRPRSSIEVSKSKGPWRPQACCGAPGPRGGRTHYTAAGALIIPRWAHSVYCDGGSCWEAPGTLEWDTCGNLVIGLQLSVRN